MKIRLSSDEGIAVAGAAVLQQMRAAQRKWQGVDHGTVLLERGAARRLGETINGLMAEYALSKALNLSWSAGVGGLKTGDINEWLFVRSTDFADGHLLITAQEAGEFPDAAYAFMVGAWPEFRFAGWCYIAEAATQERYRARGSGSTNDAYWIPQGCAEMRSFEELKRLAEHRRSA